jgi:hypothetical protein
VDESGGDLILDGKGQRIFDYGATLVKLWTESSTIKQWELMDHCTIIKLDTKEIIIQLMHFRSNFS